MDDGRRRFDGRRGGGGGGGVGRRRRPATQRRVGELDVVLDGLVVGRRFLRLQKVEENTKRQGQSK